MSVLIVQLLIGGLDCILCSIYLSFFSCGLSK